MVHTSSAFASSVLSAAVVLSWAAPTTAQAQLTPYNSEAAWQGAVTAPTLIGFDDLADGTAINGAYAGHNFSPATAAARRRWPTTFRRPGRMCWR